MQTAGFSELHLFHETRVQNKRTHSNMCWCRNKPGSIVKFKAGSTERYFWAFGSKLDP